MLHRKNALFYKTLNGARVGDLFMTLIHTAELNGIAPFHHLVALQRHHRDVALHPSAWMPWNYQETLTALRARADPPPGRDRASFWPGEERCSDPSVHVGPI